MNKLISELRIAGVVECVLLEIEKKYEVKELCSSSSSRDLMSLMVCKSLSVDDSNDSSLKEGLKETLNEKKKVVRKKVVNKAVSAGEDHVNNLCLEAFNETSAANGATVVVVEEKLKEKKVKMSAEEKAAAKTEALKVKEAEKAELKALKEEAKAAKAAEKA